MGALRHRHRRFGPGPYLSGLRKTEHWRREGFPFEVPAVDAIAGPAATAYEELEAVRFTRGFLEAPERFIRAALGE